MTDLVAWTWEKNFREILTISYLLNTTSQHGADVEIIKFLILGI